eukprot:234644-Chlamydomonas_euryale.AAC.4
MQLNATPCSPGAMRTHARPCNLSLQRLPRQRCPLPGQRQRPRLSSAAAYLLTYYAATFRLPLAC